MKLGEGGFGEIRKARDTVLDRDVALKFSKAEFTARFAQEARAMAAFSHNNICRIYDVGADYIVMELLDGVQLSGPLPKEKAVAYAGQILDALDAAHCKGIVHRDLKPANVMVTKSGLKVLDFGLAKVAPTVPIGFFNESSLERVDVAGGPALRLAPASVTTSGAWGADGTILLNPSATRRAAEEFRQRGTGGRHQTGRRRKFSFAAPGSCPMDATF